jgi:DNA-binding CsgD family transcriptional regulator
MNKSASATLSPRQQEVYDLLSASTPRHEIAKKLGISLNTLKKRAKAGFRRLDAQTALEAAAHFYRPEAPPPSDSKEPAAKEAAAKKEPASKKEAGSKEPGRPKAEAR